MGKDLHGKELGPGVMQRKDGKYSARYTGVDSRRHEKYQRNYHDRYDRDIKPYIGKMKMKDVKAMHCQQIFNAMDGSYATSTIYQTYICLGSMFKSAIQNDIVPRQPLNGVVMPEVKREVPYISLPSMSRMHLSKW